MSKNKNLDKTLFKSFYEKYFYKSQCIIFYINLTLVKAQKKQLLSITIKNTLSNIFLLDKNNIKNLM